MHRVWNLEQGEKVHAIGVYVCAICICKSIKFFEADCLILSFPELRLRALW